MRTVLKRTVELKGDETIRGDWIWHDAELRNLFSLLKWHCDNQIEDGIGAACRTLVGDEVR